MKKRTTVAVTAATSALLLQGCSGNPSDGARNYPIPSSLCDVEIDADLYDQLFPPGDSIETVGGGVSAYGWVHAGGRCTVYVNKKPAIVVDSFGSTDEAAGSGPLAPGVAPYLQFRMFDLNMDDAQPVEAGPHEVRVWQDFAAIHIPCAASPSMDYTGMNIAIDLRENADRDFSEDLKEIIEPYALDRIEMMGPGVCDNA
ncbi:hypothetical protein [Streptomyces xiamenensis]|uniref:hypothetical protein n=1 Tax=Streptomyces xiamenensis TaxID=408015 RepID=UPI003D74957A